MEQARNAEWVDITIKKVHTLLEMEDNDDRKLYLITQVWTLDSLKNKE